MNTVDIKNVFVLGGGTMGLDIAQVLARSGRNVCVFNTTAESSAKAQLRMDKTLEKLLTKGKIAEEEKFEIECRISYTVSPDDAADADLVIEAAAEKMDLKLSLFEKLDGICRPETILATNTSSLSITQIASATNRPEKVIGMHFFNPATIMKLVELIRGEKTDDETFAVVKELCEEIGKTAVEIQEAPGFVVNRLLIPMINEAAEVLNTGVASAEDVDAAMQLGANHPMGPLHLGDLIGLDVCVAIMDTLAMETGDPKYRCSPLLRKLVRAGKLGRKSGQGFFTY